MLTLVLLPGMDGTGDLFAPLATALGADFNLQIVRYPTAMPLDYAGLAAWVHRMLPAQGRFILVAESFSGPVAILLAAGKPDGLIGLVLCCTFARHPRPSILKAFVGCLPLAIVPTGLLGYCLMGRFSTPALLEALKKAIQAISPAVMRARLRAALSVDVLPQLAQIEVPILYLRASKDRVVPHAASALMVTVCPQVRVVTLDAPHFLFQVAADDAAHVVKQFADDVLQK